MKLEFRNNLYDATTDGVIEGRFQIEDGDWPVAPGPFTRRSKTTERYGRAGAVLTGDGHLSSRAYLVEFPVGGEDADSATVRDKMDELISFFEPAYAFTRENGEKYFMIVDTDVDLRALIAPPQETNPGWEKSNYLNNGICTLGLIFLDGLWEDDNENTQSATLTDQQTITINNTGRFECFPIFELTADSTIEDFVLRNLTADLAVRLESSEFKINRICVLDSVDGLIKINGVDQRRALDGGFLKLVPGNNIIRFEAGAGTVDLVARWRTRKTH